MPMTYDMVEGSRKRGKSWRKEWTNGYNGTLVTHGWRKSVCGRGEVGGGSYHRKEYWNRAVDDVVF